MLHFLASPALAWVFVAEVYFFILLQCSSVETREFRFGGHLGWFYPATSP